MAEHPNLTRPSEVRALLTQLDFHPSRLLGQNFLIDRNVLNILLAAAELQPTDAVVEVGPGLGVLPAALLERAAAVTAVEKDNRLREFGVVVVGVTPTTLVEGPGAFVAQLEHIVRMNAGRPPLPLVVTPCAVDPVWHSLHQTVESVR